MRQPIWRPSDERVKQAAMTRFIARVNDAYHLLLGAGIVWMAVSGWALYLKIRRARKKLAAARPSIVPPRDQSGTK